MEIVVVTDIATEPVTVQEAKDYMRIIGSDEDALIAELIKSARQRLEGFTNRSFGSKTLKVRWNELNGWQELPYSPIQSITSVKNDDLDTLTYESKGLEVKQIEVFSFDGVIVQYVAGFTTLPKALKEAILKEVSTAYENRENYILADSATILSNEAKVLASRFSRNTLLGF